LPFAEAYGLDRLNPPTSEGVRIDRSMLTPGVIPAYTYGSEPAEPAKECPTICAPLILAAEVIGRMCAQQRSDRYASLAEALEDLPICEA
jgi:hypothetical protein